MGTASYTRTRTKEISLAGTCDRLHTSVNASGAVVGPTATERGPALQSYSRMSDTVTENYHKRVAAGEIINNPMVKTTVNHDFEVGSFVDTWLDGPYGSLTSRVYHDNVCISRQRPGAFEFTSVTTPASSEMAINQAYARANGSCSELLVDLAEGGQTIRMLRETLLTAVKLKRGTLLYLGKHGAREMLRDVRRVYKKGIPRLLEESLSNASGYYLQYRYGWMPLLYSLEDAVKSAQAPVGDSTRVTGRGFDAGEGRSEKTLTTLYDPLGTGIPLLNTSLTGTRTLSEAYRAGVLAEVDLTRADRFGLGLSDIPSAALELIPYSFVVGWFVGLSDWLAAWTPQIGMKILATWCVHTSVYTDVRRATVHAMNQTKGSGSTFKQFIRNECVDTHTVCTEVKQRSINVERSSLPPLDKHNLSLTHAVDALALAYQGFGKDVYKRSFRR